MDEQQVRTEYQAVWSLFKATSPHTGKLLAYELSSADREYLLKAGYIVEDEGQPDWVMEPGAEGWRIFSITDAGVQVIRRIHYRDVWAKQTTHVCDTFTDGLIRDNQN